MREVMSDVPGRLDALGWSAWHRRVILALGITWILDGLEASLISNLGPSLQDPRALGLSATEVGLSSSVFLVGEVVGALGFGYLTDRHGRKKLFLVTLLLYLIATALSGAAPNFAVFLVLRAFAGAGIGGEYAAVNSAIDELVPARIRGHVDLAINGSYWIGVAMGAGVTLAILDGGLPLAIGWRLAFGLGAVLGFAILLVRRHVPESPRWLLNHGRVDEAEAIVAEIEKEIGAPAAKVEPRVVRVHGAVGFGHLLNVLFVKFPRRAILGLVLMLAQAFLYNAIFSSYGLILTKFHGVDPKDVSLYIVPFAIGNFTGPLLLGRLFDRLGRRVMIPATYAGSGLMLFIAGLVFYGGYFTALTQTLAWSAVFFVASAAASSAYLTVSELFPMEIRAMAIAVFYAFATLVGAGAPTLFGWIVDTGEPRNLVLGYSLAAVLMIGAAIVARFLGVAAEGRSLEDLGMD